MKKTELLFVLIAVTSFTQSIAKERSNDEAQQIAKAFATSLKTIGNSKSNMKKVAANATVTPAFVGTSTTMTSNMDTVGADYYAYNIGNGNGYVIVSGDDDAEDVLGYADNGTISTEEMPENMKGWLEGYARQIEFLKQKSSSKTARKKAASSTIGTAAYRFYQPTYSSAVDSLLGNIKYNQKAPYYYNCPKITDTCCVTGCVATAMAQVMTKWKYPASATGFINYTTRGTKIAVTANASSTYDWTKFSDRYSTKSNIGKDTIEVEKLMFDCGVSVQMNYNLASKGGSGAYSNDACKALINNFGYGDAIILFKDNMNADKWEKTLKAELDAGRPVIYSGHGSKGGHTFVCDGYDISGKYHFNWGWSGVMDGFFALTALNPQNKYNNFEFNSYNDMVLQIDPTKPDAPDENYNLLMENVSGLKTNTDGTIDFNLPLYNGYVRDFAGVIALDILDINGNVKATQTVNSSASIAGMSLDNIGHATFSITSYSLPSDLEDGTYFIRAKYKTTAESNWHYVKQIEDIPNFLRVTKASGATTVGYQLSYPANMTLNTLSASTNSLYSGGAITFKANITNNSTVPYSSDCAVMLVNKTDNSDKILIDKKIITIAAGATSDIEFAGSVAADMGNYSAYLMVDTVNCPSTVTETSALYSLGDAADVDVCPVLDETSTTYAVTAGTYNAVKFTRTLKAGMWNTICLPFSLSAAQITSLFGAETVVAQYDALKDANALNFSATTTMTANTPYLIKPQNVNTDNTYTLSGTIAIDGNNAKRVTFNDGTGNVASLTGNFTSITVPIDSFFISSNKFYMATSSTTKLKGFRAYVSILPTSAGAKANGMSFNVDETLETTSITNVDAGKEDKEQEIYNLNGQLVRKGNIEAAQLPKGIYMVEGNKIIIK